MKAQLLVGQNDTAAAIALLERTQPDVILITAPFPGKKMLDRTSMNTWEDVAVIEEINRIGKDRIVPPHSDPVDLSVFCVEPGRWTETSAQFKGLGVQMAQPSVRQKAMARKDPVLFVVSMMDKDHADFDRAYRMIKDRLTAKVVPVEIPIGAGPGLTGVINLFAKKAYLPAKNGRAGEYEEAEIPASERERFQKYHQEMVEAIAATDDALLERFFGGEDLPGDDEMAAMKEAMKRADLFPLLCCSSQLTYGVRTVLAAIVPWLVLLGTVLAVPGILIMLGIGTFAVPFGVAYVPGLGIATIAAIAGFVLNALALPGLFGRGMAGWTWIFYGELVSIASSLLRGAVVSAVVPVWKYRLAVLVEVTPA